MVEALHKQKASEGIVFLLCLPCGLYLPLLGKRESDAYKFSLPYLRKIWNRKEKCRLKYKYKRL